MGYEPAIGAELGPLIPAVAVLTTAGIEAVTDPYPGRYRSVL